MNLTLGWACPDSASGPWIKKLIRRSWLIPGRLSILSEAWKRKSDGSNENPNFVTPTSCWQLTSSIRDKNPCSKCPNRAFGGMTCCGGPSKNHRHIRGRDQVSPRPWRWHRQFLHIPTTGWCILRSLPTVSEAILPVSWFGQAYKRTALLDRSLCRTGSSDAYSLLALLPYSRLSLFLDQSSLRCSPASSVPLAPCRWLMDSVSRSVASAKLPPALCNCLPER